MTRPSLLVWRRVSVPISSSSPSSGDQKKFRLTVGPSANSSITAPRKPSPVTIPASHNRSAVARYSSALRTRKNARSNETVACGALTITRRSISSGEPSCLG